MTTPYRGSGRGNARGRGRGRGSNNILPHSEVTVPLIGDWTVYHNRTRNVRQLPAPSKKEDIPSSSNSGKVISYKEIAVTDPPPLEKEYFENHITENILYLENEDVQITPNDGWSSRSRYLESRGYAGLHGQDRKYLEILLTVTESVTITHHFQNNNPESFINFSKCHINKVLLPREWGLSPNGDKAIKIAEGRYIYYNYWDYIQAFSKAFYYQNPKNKHSWFFSINPEILEKPVPNWFFEWWSKFGPSLEILPKQLMDLYNPWNKSSPLVAKYVAQGLIYGQCPFLFFTKFQIPWIWRWAIIVAKDNRLSIPLLRRQFFFKWWNKMADEDIKEIIISIKEAINEDESKSEVSDSKCPSMASMKQYFQNRYPQESEEKIMGRVLDHMKNQFLNTFPVQFSKEEDESMKTVSSQGSLDSNTFKYLAGESQEEEPEPSPEDIWDSLIETFVQQARNSAKGKGPEQK